MKENKKFFTLFHSQDVKIAPGKKILPASLFSETLSLQELIQKTKEDALLYRQEVTKECETLKEQAEKTGFEEGLKKWVEQISFLENEIKKVHDETIKMVVPLAIKAAKKILGREIEQSENAIVDIVSNHLKAVTHHKKIKIYVSKNDYQILEQHKEDLKKLFEYIESISIIEREGLSSGDFVIETEGGIINAQLENIWQILEKAFESFFKGGSQK